MLQKSSRSKVTQFPWVHTFPDDASEAWSSVAIASLYLVLAGLLLRVNLISINCIGYIIEAMDCPQLAKQQLLWLAGSFECALNSINHYSKMDIFFFLNSGIFHRMLAINLSFKGYTTLSFKKRWWGGTLGRLINITNIYSITTTLAK